jgi:hypothetical protein
LNAPPTLPAPFDNSDFAEKLSKIRAWVTSKPGKDNGPGVDIGRACEITLQFVGDTDMSIFDFIESEAKRCRRTPDQQALWMLQSHLPESRAAIFYKAQGDHNEINPGAPS